jgi:hypothetical protein
VASVTSAGGPAGSAGRAGRSVDQIIDDIATVAVREWTRAVAPSGLGSYSNIDLDGYNSSPRQALDLRRVAAQLNAPYVEADGSSQDHYSGWNRLIDEIARRAQESTPDDYSGPGLRVQAVASPEDLMDLQGGGSLTIALITGPDSGRYGRVGRDGLPASQQVFYPDASMGPRRVVLWRHVPGQQLSDADVAARPSGKPATGPQSTVARVRSFLSLVPKLGVPGKPRREVGSSAAAAVQSRDK